MATKYYRHQEKEKVVHSDVVYLRKNLLQRFHFPLKCSINSMELIEILLTDPRKFELFLFIDKNFYHEFAKFLSHYNLTKDKFIILWTSKSMENKLNDTKSEHV